MIMINLGSRGIEREKERETALEKFGGFLDLTLATWKENFGDLKFCFRELTCAETDTWDSEPFSPAVKYVRRIVALSWHDSFKK